MKKKQKKTFVIVTLVLIFILLIGGVGTFIFMNGSRQSVISFGNTQTNSQQVYCSPYSQYYLDNRYSSSADGMDRAGRCSQLDCSADGVGYYRGICPDGCNFKEQFIPLKTVPTSDIDPLLNQPIGTTMSASGSFIYPTCPGSNCQTCPGSQKCFPTGKTIHGVGIGNCKCTPTDCNLGDILTNDSDNMQYSVCISDSNTRCAVYESHRCNPGYFVNVNAQNSSDICKPLPPIVNFICTNPNLCKFGFGEDFNGIKITTNINSNTIVPIKVFACPVDKDCSAYSNKIVRTSLDNGQLLLDCNKSSIDCLDYRPTFSGDWNITATLTGSYNYSKSFIIHVNPTLLMTLTCKNPSTTQTGKITTCSWVVIDRDNQNTKLSLTDLSPPNGLTSVDLRLNGVTIPSKTGDNVVEFTPDKEGTITLKVVVNKSGYNGDIQTFTQTSSLNFTNIEENKTVIIYRPNVTSSSDPKWLNVDNSMFTEGSSYKTGNHKLTLNINPQDIQGVSAYIKTSSYQTIDLNFRNDGNSYSTNYNFAEPGLNYDLYINIIYRDPTKSDLSLHYTTVTASGLVDNPQNYITIGIYLGIAIFIIAVIGTIIFLVLKRRKSIR